MGSFLTSSFLDVLYWVTQKLPNSTGFGLDFNNAISQVMVVGYQLSFVINWRVMFQCLFAVIVFETGLFIYKHVITWIIHLIATIL